jgi:hypothetical protein
MRLTKVDWLVIVVMLLLGFLCAISMAYAERVPTWEGDKLVITTVPDPEIIQGRPKGLLPEDALKLRDGKKREVTIEDGYEKKVIYSLDFPWLHTKISARDARVTFDGKRFVPYPVAMLKVKESSDVGLSVLFLWLPVILLLVVSVKGAWMGVNLKRLFFLYASFFTATIVTGILGIFIILEHATITGLLAGIIALAVAGGFVAGLTGALSGLVVGFFSNIIGVVIQRQNLKDSLPLIMFFLVAQVISFGIAWATGAVKKSRAQQKEAMDCILI